MLELAAISSITGAVTGLVKGAIDSRSKRKDKELTIALIREERQSLSERLKHERVLATQVSKDNASERFSANSKAVFKAEEKSFQIAQAKGGVAQYVRPVLLLFLGFTAYQYAGDSIEFQEDLVDLFAMASGFYFGSRLTGSLK